MIFINGRMFFKVFLSIHLEKRTGDNVVEQTVNLLSQSCFLKMYLKKKTGEKQYRNSRNYDHTKQFTEAYLMKIIL